MKSPSIKDLVMLILGLIIALVGIAMAVFWRRDPGLAVFVIGVIIAVVSLLIGDGGATLDT